MSTKSKKTKVPTAVVDREPAGERLLIVEDVVANVDVLMSALGDGYTLGVALNGTEALRCAAADPPDLILLDVMMPGMDGYQVCERLKSSPDTRDIPVIFLTSLSEEADEEKGLRLGAVDYITKPFSPALVRARVRSHLALRRARLEALSQRDEIAATHQRLVALEKLRDDLVHMIVHDMRSPLTILEMTMGLLAAEEGLTPSLYPCLRGAQSTVSELSRMATSLVDVSRLESGQMPLRRASFELNRVVETALQRLGSLIGCRKITIGGPEPSVSAYGDSEVMERIVQNLLSNAVKFTSPEGQIRIELGRRGTFARLSVQDNGLGIPQQYHQKIFEKFGQVEARKEGKQPSVGLGLAFCKLAAEAQGGKVEVESSPGHGATFHVYLPQAGEA